MQQFCFLFPGQGAQYVGMGKTFYDMFPTAKHCFEEADEILNKRLSEIIFHGPESLLTETKVAQPAIFVTSMAILRVLKEEFSLTSPVCTAGLSLGEYSAVVSSGALDFQKALKLVNLRGELMHKACEETKGGMLVILGLSDEQVRNLVSELNMPNDLWAANFNCPGQVVVSGTAKGIEAAQKKAKELGAKRALPLQVHGAFHSGLMLGAQQGLQKALSQVQFTTPVTPIVTNTTGEFCTDITQLRQNLEAQVTSSVLWHQCIQSCMTKKFSHFIEIGCGTTLAGLNKRIGVTLPTLTIETVDDLKLLEKVI